MHPLSKAQESRAADQQTPTGREWYHPHGQMSAPLQFQPWTFPNKADQLIKRLSQATGIAP